MSAFVDAIETALTTAGVIGGNWVAHKLAGQEQPDTAVIIYETAGPEPEQATDRRWRRPTFQITVRGSRYDAKAASDKAHAALVALDRATIAGFNHFRAAQSVPFYAGPDGAGRPTFTVNFRGGEL